MVCMKQDREEGFRAPGRVTVKSASEQCFWSFTLAHAQRLQQCVSETIQSVHKGCLSPTSPSFTTSSKNVIEKLMSFEWLFLGVISTLWLDLVFHSALPCLTCGAK